MLNCSWLVLQLCLLLRKFHLYISQFSKNKKKFNSLFINIVTFIYSKYEEIYPPEVGEFVYITDDTYTKKQVLRMEHLILRVLSFDLTVPTPLAFLMEYCISNNLSEKVQFLAMVRIIYSYISNLYN